MTAIFLACLFLVSHTDIRLVAVQVPVEFVSALTLMFLSNTPLSRIPSKDYVKENQTVDQERRFPFGISVCRVF
jgi:hypothetical protein